MYSSKITLTITIRWPGVDLGIAVGESSKVIVDVEALADAVATGRVIAFSADVSHREVEDGQ